MAQDDAADPGVGQPAKRAQPPPGSPRPDLVQRAAALSGAIGARVLAAKGDVTVQLSDLLVFMGYFGLCLYAGGVAHVEAYNSELRLAILSSDGVVATGQLYLINTLGSFWSAFALALGIALLSCVYVIARFALRLWLGLAAVVGLFCLLIVFCVLTGAEQGRSAALAAFVTDDNHLPVIKLTGNADPGLAGGNYRLLHDSGSHFFLVQPTASSASIGEIRVFSKKDLRSYEVVLQ